MTEGYLQVDRREEQGTVANGSCQNPGGPGSWVPHFRNNSTGDFSNPGGRNFRIKNLLLNAEIMALPRCHRRVA